jgi:3-phosphoglycerate kinase
MKKIENLKVRNKRVLVRVDFNVPLDEKGNVLDNYRLKVSLSTIKYLKERGARVILISHLGRPSGEEKKCSLEQVVPELEKLLGERVKFYSDWKIGLIKPGQVVLLENLRFHKGETENDLGFAKRLAKLGDFYVNDAFSVCHRSHASVVRLSKLLPAVPGLLLRKEMEVLSKIKEKPKRPLVVVVGGKKLAKIESLPQLLHLSDYLLLNGFISENILIAKEILVGRSFPEAEILKNVQKMNLTSPKLHLPEDVLISLKKDWTYKRIAGLGTLRREEMVFDIGDETIKLYSEIIKKARTIFWAGPLGFFEEDRFSKGTKEVGEKIIRNHKAFKVAGGGDTISALRKFNWLDKLDHVSTGGSALLKFLCGKKLPGIEALG